MIHFASVYEYPRGKTPFSSLRTVHVRIEVENDDAIKTGLLGSEQSQEDAILIAYERYAAPLASYVRESIAPTLDSDELATVVSEVFCELARRVQAGKFTLDGSLPTLLFRMARCEAIDRLRHKQAQKRKAEPNPEDTEHQKDSESESLIDEGLTVQIAQKLSSAPGIAAEWRTAVDEASANEIMRQFRMLVGSLPRLQRKVAEVIALHCGDVTDAEVAEEIGESGERPSVASVKSARRQIGEKFSALIPKNERTTIP